MLIGTPDPRSRETWGTPISSKTLIEVKIPTLVPAKNAGTRVGHPIHCYFDEPYTRPWSSMELATFMKPAMLAPFT
jgi:hypothetical protein